MALGNFLKISTLTGIAFVNLQFTGLAQSIQADNSLNTRVERLGTEFIIQDGTFVPGDLNNLFHSFEQFNLQQGETATFENTVDADSIFARVTGGDASVINGAINGGDVNLFLMNPSGLIFNENASLQLDRSFFGVTADSISFFDNSTFSASLSTGAPTGDTPFSFIFNGNNGDIEVVSNSAAANAVINVDVDRTFALIGSNVRISNIDEIRAPSGRIEIIGIGSQSFLEAPIFVDSENSLGISFPAGTFPEGNGQVLIENTNISSEAAPNSTELNPDNLFSSTDTTSDFQEDLNAGGVFVRASGEIIIRDSNITAFTTSMANAGYVGLQTSPQGDITLSNGDVFATVEQEDANGQIASGPRGQGGAIIVDTGTLTLKDSSQLQVLVRGGVNSPDTFAGVILIQTTGAVTLEGSDQFDFPPGIFASVGSDAQASSGLVFLDVGSLEIDASDGLALIEASNFGEGSAGVIIIDADDDVVVKGNGGLILSRAVNAPGDSSFEFQGQSPGFIFIDARRVGVLNGAEISATSEGAATPGQIGIVADLIAMNRGLPITSPNGSIRNTGISAENTSGQGGLIALDSEFLVLANKSSITTISNFENNGTSPDNFQGVSLNIDFEIIASPSSDNDITVDARGTGGSAGIVEFVAGTQPFLRNIEIQDSSLLSNDISFNGEGGASDGALLGAFSEFSSFQPTAEPSPDTIDPSRLIAQGCTAGGLSAAQNVGDLTVTGREGLSVTPEEKLTGTMPPSRLASSPDDANLAEADAWIAANNNNAMTDATSSAVEAQTWRYGDDGQVVLAAQPHQTYSPVLPGFICNAL